MPRFNVVTDFTYQTWDGRHFRYTKGEHEIPADIAAIPFVQQHIQRTLHPWEAELLTSQPKPWPQYVPPPEAEAKPVEASPTAERKPQPQRILAPFVPSAAATALSETKEVMRARRALLEVIEDAREELTTHQREMQSLYGGLSNAEDDGAEERVAEARRRLKILNARVDVATRNLSAFNETNPTAEELERRAREEEKIVDQEARAETRRRFGVNLARRIALLDELETLETDAQVIWKEAERWTCNAAQGNAWAGIARDLVGVMPQDFWCRSSYGPSGPINYYLYRNDIRKRAIAWLEQWGIPLEPQSDENVNAEQSEVAPLSA
jgi:hypothetical protein